MRMRRLAITAIMLACAAGTAAAQTFFWEEPTVKAPSGVSYSGSAANDSFLVLSWQERTGTGASSAVSIWTDTARLDAPNADTRWAGRRLVHGPIPLPGVGEEPRMHALAVDDRRILVAVVLPSTAGDEVSEVLIKSSEDAGNTFREIARFKESSVVTSPDLSKTADGGWMLMLTRSETVPGSGTQAASVKLSIAYSVSSDGVHWPTLQPLVTNKEESTDKSLRQNIQPHHVVMGKTDYVVFQSMRETNHLYLKRSTDGGRTWGDSLPITSGDGFQEAVTGKAGLQKADDFSNQRPSLAPIGDRLGLVWERAFVGSTQTPVYQIYYCELDGEGAVVLPKENVSQAGSALYPQMVTVDGKVRILYARQPPQSRLMLATRTKGWETSIVAPSLDAGTFVSHGTVLDDRLFVFAEVLSAKNAWALYAIRPDTSAPAPALRPLDFSPGTPANRDSVAVSWSEPEDPSRITSYRYTWGLDGSEAKPVELRGASQQLALDAPTDGAWTLAVWSTDRAGNTTRDPARVTFIRDATPPKAVTLFLQPAPLLDGYQPSNDFAISWTGPADDRIARYEVSAPLPTDGGLLVRQADSLRAENVDDGEYTVKVSAVDLAGNVGPPASITLRLNRYRPVTYIARVDERKDSGDNLVLQLVGRGFSASGIVREVYLDRDRLPPYEHTLKQAAGQFAVPNDRHITGITLGSDYDTADYFVGVLNPTRGGVLFATKAVAFQAPGTVKIGDFSFRWAPRWAAARTSRLHVPFVVLLVVLSAGLIAVLLVVSSRRLVATAREGAVLKAEVLALLEGRPALITVEETERKIKELHRRGIGLRLKFSMLVSVLVIIIVAGVAVPLGLQMITREQRILAEELLNRSNLLLDSAAARAASPLRAGTAGFATVSNIPASIGAMQEEKLHEALYLSITGPRVPLPAAADPVDRDYLWATNDPYWPEGSFEPAQLQLDDRILTRGEVVQITAELNADAATKLKDLLEENRRLSAESDRLAKIAIGKNATPADVAEYKSTGQKYAQVQADGRSRINELAKDKKAARSGTIPAFDPNNLATEYLFYRPIVDFVQDGNFTLGMVRLKISTELIQGEIASATLELIRTMVLISLVAVGAGVIGAVILAGITIGPVRKLAAGVAKIRDTEDKSKLAEIAVGSRDEIGTLADAVNEMTRGLVKAAKDKAELLVGKSVQKRFLPLEEAGGEKGSTGGRKTDHFDIYGYYEGAKGVSGDYFDFQQLDDRHYAIINCDVAGKGVPAAMIMVEVATLFIGWCQDWTRQRAGARRGSDGTAGLDTLVYTINDMLEERGFEGRFAALTVALYDLETGTLTVCTAGNNVLYVYDVDQGAILPHPLPVDPPAAGVFPSLLVEAKTGFPQLRLLLDRGDALFLFTDGFEESKRSFRTWGGDIVPCAEPGLKEGELHLETHARGQTSEEFGIPRISGVVNAVFGRGTYRLVRHHTISREDLEFDFSGCTGTVKEAVLALVCVEKVFRVYRDALTGPGHLVYMESKVDEFLRNHFRQYDELFRHRVDDGKQSGTAAFSHLKEDPQYDDLTLLVVRRP
ncbi:MAG: SpoIIE family protein phosphatase [Spirochaetes bacterium]|nr:SpoIIE family protein phosphatase [Spirochaetota bacterium]